MPDGLPALFYKKVLCLRLSISFNKSMNAGTVLTVWWQAIVIPINKKGPVYSMLDVNALDAMKSTLQHK